MSDSIIIQAVYIAIGPFFVVDAGGDESTKGKKDNVVLKTLGTSAMRGLRLDALSLIRSVSYFGLHFIRPIDFILSRSSLIMKINDLGSLKKS